MLKNPFSPLRRDFFVGELGFSWGVVWGSFEKCVEKVCFSFVKCAKVALFSFGKCGKVIVKVVNESEKMEEIVQ